MVRIMMIVCSENASEKKGKMFGLFVVVVVVGRNMSGFVVVIIYCELRTKAILSLVASCAASIVEVDSLFFCRKPTSSLHTALFFDKN